MQIVKVIGWGDLNEKPHWIIENSWGTDWGMEGIAYVDMDEKAFYIS